MHKHQKPFPINQKMHISIRKLKILHRLTVKKPSHQSLQLPANPLAPDFRARERTKNDARGLLIISKATIVGIAYFPRDCAVVEI